MQQIPDNPAVAGFEAVDFRIDSGVRLVIRDIEPPTRDPCFPSGLSGGLMPPTPAPNPPAPCAVGGKLAPAGLCRVDVDPRCRVLSGVVCHDNTTNPTRFDAQYTVTPNRPGNLPRFTSNDGTCSGIPLGSAANSYIIAADSPARADASCPLTFAHTMASFGFTTAPANRSVCTDLAA